MWHDYETADWSDNGTEQAAEIIAWGLNDRIAPALQITVHSCQDLVDGYVALTGAQPLHGLTRVCSPEPTNVQ